MRFLFSYNAMIIGIVMRVKARERSEIYSYSSTILSVDSPLYSTFQYLQVVYGDE